MFFPNAGFMPIAETAKNQKYQAARLIPMRSSAGQAALFKVKTGDGCEVSSCYQTATWVLALNDVSYHLCTKHAKIKMRDSYLWESVANGKVEA
jgi:hypothetical protein